MKLLSSPSISASSSTASSFDTNMSTSSKSVTAGCLSALLRRFLCSRSLPTHPSDHITETSSLSCHSTHQECIKSQEKDNAASAAPGIVARLMGLDYFPLTSSADDSPNSMSRTRSLDSAIPTQEDEQMQRQSTMSFLENERFFVLSFEESGGGKSKRNRSRVRKCGELKPKRRETMEEEMINRMVLRVLNEAELCNRISEDSNAQVKKFTNNGARLRRRNRKRNDLANQNDETESSTSSISQDASPVSVLDFGQFILDPEVPISEEDTKSGDSNSRRGLSAELEMYSQLSHTIGDSSIADDLNSNETEETFRGESRRKANPIRNCSNLWGRICSLTKSEVAESSWICKFEEQQDISKDFGLQILDDLLEELVLELP